MRELPPRPNLDQLKKQAKDIHRAHQRGDASCCEVLRWLHRFAGAGDELVLALPVSLSEVQHALAMDYGFTGWASLRSFVERMRSDPQPYPSVPTEVVRGWQSTVDVLAEVMHVPAALIMRLHSEEIEVLLSSRSEGNPYQRGDLEKVWGSGLYCEHVVRTRAFLLVPNAHTDPDWAYNPDIELGMIAYMGLPIIDATGEVFGTICVLDAKENHFSSTYKRLMERMKEQIEAHLHLHHARHFSNLRSRQLHGTLAKLRSLTALVPICSHCRKVRDGDGDWVTLESYFDRGKVSFSHAICPCCEETGC